MSNKEENLDNDEGREDRFMDVDRMINEGLGGGRITSRNGYIGKTSVDTMCDPDSVAVEVERYVSGKKDSSSDSDLSSSIEEY